MSQDDPLTFEQDGTRHDYRVGLRFEAGPDIPEPDHESADGPWELVAVDRDNERLRFGDRDWHPVGKVQEFIDDGHLSVAGEADEDSPALTQDDVDYLLQPGLKFIVEPSFLGPGADPERTGDPVELVLETVEGQRVTFLERVGEDGEYVEMGDGMSLSTIQRGVELSDVQCVGMLPSARRRELVGA